MWAILVTTMTILGRLRKRSADNRKLTEVVTISVAMYFS